jgi:hypothetical protein
VLLAFLLLWCVQAVLVEMRAQGCTTADDHNHYLTAALNSSNKHVGKYRSALLRECLLDMLKEGFAPEDSSFVRVMEVCALRSTLNTYCCVPADTPTVRADLCLNVCTQHSAIVIRSKRSR